MSISLREMRNGAAAKRTEAPTGLGSAPARLGDQRGVHLQQAYIQVPDVDTAIRNIRTHWERAQSNFLACGRYLDDMRRLIRDELSDEFAGTELDAAIARRWRDEVLTQLPFQGSVANQLMAVARAIYIDKRFDEAELPRNYSVAYQVVTMDAERLKFVRAQGLLRSDITRSRIVELKKMPLTIDADIEDSCHDAAAGHQRQRGSLPVTTPLSDRERELLLRRRQKLRARLRAIQDAISEVGAQLGEPAGGAYGG